MHASTPLILRKSRMRRRARTDLCGGRSVMVVPTATMIHSADKRQPDMTRQPASAQCLSKRRLTGLRLSTCILEVPSLSRHARGKAAPLRGPLHDMKRKMASLVIVGRPNVGKSTLFNRLTGTRRSIVTNEPGITRDRIYGEAEWRGHRFEVVDTGGIVPDDKALIPREILRQAHVAIEKAALLLLVVDSQAGITPLDEELARLLRSTGKPFFVAVNKVDSPLQKGNAGAFHRIGAQVFPVTAEHGTGVDDLLDAAIAEVYPGAGAGQAAGASGADVEAAEEREPVEIAIIGRPNVGKSTLLNRMVGEERSIVSPTPGTTMDTVDTEVTRDGRVYRFVDTAG